MPGKILPSVALILISLCLCAGCVTPGGGGTPTPTPTTQTIPTTPPTPGVTIPPGPVVTVPPQYEVVLQVMKNPVTAFPDIVVTFRGGAGQIFLQRIAVTVSRSDGQVIQEVVPESGPGQYAIGDSVSIPGTEGPDRVVVVVTVNGVDYKVYDQVLDVPLSS